MSQSYILFNFWFKKIVFFDKGIRDCSGRAGWTGCDVFEFNERAVKIICNLIVGAIATGLFGDPAIAHRESTTLRV